MIIDLSDFKSAESIREVKREVSLESFEFRHREVKIPEKFEINIEIYNTEDSFVITGSLTGNIRLECSRCLELFTYPVDVKLEAEIDKNNIDDLERVDLIPVIKENILLAIPIKPLCSEECKGLCPQCGQNLNRGECDCDTETVDPRLAELKNFFDD